MKAVLGLEDGSYVHGEGFGAEGVAKGELVFSTQMTGYMEALSDPSYHGQILMFTFPTIGIYGVDLDNLQSSRVWATACVTRALQEGPRQGLSLMKYYEDQGLSGLTGVDTRMLTIKTRVEGTLRAALIVGSDDAAQAIEAAKSQPALSDRDLIEDVTCPAPYRIPGTGKRVAVIDLGMKQAMIRSLVQRNADLHIYPAGSSADEVTACRPDAVFITNGPGDPERARGAIRTVKGLIGQVPIFGICMGIQICGLALGGRTYKLKFGHRGSNQPVRYKDGSIFITTQNHGYAVEAGSLPEGCSVSYTNVNDGTLEGFEERDLDIHCVQFHPEAHGGPRDTEVHFFDAMFQVIA
jgi:carbamoyl-phosphate synthase small subunit